MKLILLLTSLFALNFSEPIEKYKLLSVIAHDESNTDSVGNYSCLLTLNLFPLDSISPPFSKDLKVISNNNQTGYFVDSVREYEVIKYMNKINK